MAEPLIPPDDEHNLFVLPSTREDLGAAFRVLARPGRVRGLAWHGFGATAPIIGWIREPRVRKSLLAPEGSARWFQPSRRDGAMVFPIAADHLRDTARGFRRLPRAVVPIQPTLDPRSSFLNVTFLIRPCLRDAVLTRWERHLRETMIRAGGMPAPGVLDEMFSYLYRAGEVEAEDTCGLLLS